MVRTGPIGDGEPLESLLKLTFMPSGTFPRGFDCWMITNISAVHPMLSLLQDSSIRIECRMQNAEGRRQKSRRLIAFSAFCILHSAFAFASANAFRWGGDAEGGAPFVEADPNNPSIVRGFDVEVAEEIAKGLGRRAEFVQVTFTAIDQSVERGDFDIGMSGVEDTPARRASHEA